MSPRPRVHAALRLDGKRSTPAERERCASGPTSAAAGARIPVPGEFVDLPPRGTHYLVGHVRLSPKPAEDGRELYGLVVAEAGSGRCHVAPLMGYELPAAAAALFSVFAGGVAHLRRGWPISVTFDDPDLCEALREGLEAEGVTCRYDAVLLPVIEVMDGLSAVLGEEPGEEAGSASPHDRVPRPA